MKNGIIKLDPPRYIYEQYKLWEDNWELINGYPYAMAPAPMIKHQSISNKIARYLDIALEDCEYCQALLPVDWKISEDTIVQPDNSVAKVYKLHQGTYIKVIDASDEKVKFDIQECNSSFEFDFSRIW